MLKSKIIALAGLLISLHAIEASAFWGSDAPELASGLDVAAGFDINTIKTLTGPVLSVPERAGQGQHTTMSLATAEGSVTVVLGPWWYWEKHSLSVTRNQDVDVTGSLAQGKDGALYLFAQSVVNRSTGATVTLRSESGKPLWSREGQGSGARRQGGARFGAGRGAGMRGGGR